jgi:hypothetical protein
LLIVRADTWMTRLWSHGRIGMSENERYKLKHVPDDLGPRLDVVDVAFVYFDSM